MNLTRRSLFGLIGGALASLGLDGPAKAASGFAKALVRKVRRPKIIVYTLDITSPPTMRYNVIHEIAGADLLMAQGIKGFCGGSHIEITDGFVLSKDESLIVRIWKDNYEEADETRIVNSSIMGKMVCRNFPSRFNCWVDFKCGASEEECLNDMVSSWAPWSTIRRSDPY